MSAITSLTMVTDIPSASDPTVFLSYARTDVQVAREVAKRLRQQGIAVWLDVESIKSLKAGQNWEQTIRQALLSADVVVVLVTPNSLESSWVAHEWTAAFRQSRLVIPVVAGGLTFADLPSSLARVQGAVFDPDDPRTLKDVVQRVQGARKAPTPQRPADAINVDEIVAMVTDQVLNQLQGKVMAEAGSDQSDDSVIFAMMSFTPDMDPTFEAISSAAIAVGLTAERVKDVPGDYRITDRILEMIRSARFVVADLTHERPNVYFELGYARGLGKTVVTILREGSLAHFDVQDWTILSYSDSRPLERDLIKRFNYELGR